MLKPPRTIGEQHWHSRDQPHQYERPESKCNDPCKIPPPGLSPPPPSLAQPALSPNYRIQKNEPVNAVAVNPQEQHCQHQNDRQRDPPCIRLNLFPARFAEEVRRCRPVIGPVNAPVGVAASIGIEVRDASTATTATSSLPGNQGHYRQPRPQPKTKRPEKHLFCPGKGWRDGFHR